MAFVAGLSGLFVGVALWGAYLGLSQGLLSALVADTAPEDLRGTAFGVFNLVTGGTLLVASSLAGILWRWVRTGRDILFRRDVRRTCRCRTHCNLAAEPASWKVGAMNVAALQHLRGICIASSACGLMQHLGERLADDCGRLATLSC